MNVMNRTGMVLVMLLMLVVSVHAADRNLLTMVSEQEARGEVKEVYDEVRAAFGGVPNAIKHQSMSPEMMRMMVGNGEDCHYCVGANEGLLVNIYKLSMDEVNAIKKDPTTAKLDAKQKAMFLFLVKSTGHPKSVTRSDINGLKKLGWSEKDIFEGVRYAGEC